MKEALKEMYQVLLTEPHTPTVCTKLERIAREALAQPEQKPVAWSSYEYDGVHHKPVAYFNPQVKGGFYWAKPTKITAPITVSVEPMPLYTTPPQRSEASTLVRLTNEEKQQCIYDEQGYVLDYEDCVDKTEAKLKEKNT